MYQIEKETGCLVGLDVSAHVLQECRPGICHLAQVDRMGNNVSSREVLGSQAIACRIF